MVVILMSPCSWELPDELPRTFRVTLPGAVPRERSTVLLYHGHDLYTVSFLAHHLGRPRPDLSAHIIEFARSTLIYVHIPFATTEEVHADAVALFLPPSSSLAVSS